MSDFDLEKSDLVEISKNCEEFSKVVPIERLSFEYNIKSRYNEIWNTTTEPNWMVVSPYYRNMAALVKLYERKNILELGTQVGAGAVSLAEYSDRVTTVDLTLRNVAPSVFRHPRIEFRKLPGDYDVLNLDFEKFDLIFIDIDHSGEVEMMLHKKLERCYKGIVLWDDVRFSPGMENVWNAIKQEKIELRHWHEGGSFGIVRYDGIVRSPNE